MFIQPLSGSAQHFVGIGGGTTRLPQMGHQLPSYRLKQVSETGTDCFPPDIANQCWKYRPP
jgi:hypothetical protein